MTGENHCQHDRWVSGAVERYEAPLVRYACRLTGNEEQARDVVQETFLRLCRETSAKLDGHLAEWLYTVCRRRALDVLKKETRMTTLQEHPAEVPAGPASDHVAALERRETTDEILAALDALPCRQQEVVRLKFQSGLSYREIAQFAGLSISNVGYLIHTAIKTIRGQLAGEANSPHKKQ